MFGISRQVVRRCSAAGAFLILSTALYAQSPPNDDFANRQVLSGTSLSVAGSNVGATTEPGEPQHGSVPDSSSIWFSWTAPANGGVVVEVTNDFTFSTPIVAVYTGTTLSTLTKLVYNSTGFNVARGVFTAVAGQTYQIAVDGAFGGQGDLTLNLNLSPPPANDLFANATSVSGTFYEFTGSFVGADRETGEPNHGQPGYGQTLWWTWTAPSNSPASLSVRLLADAVSFPPGIGVYTGNSVSALNAVALSMRTNGMSSDAVFTATPGTVYSIALAGLESDPASSAPLVGFLRFRLNCRALALSFLNFSATTNDDGSIPFTVDARIDNLGGAASGPMQLKLSAISGVSSTQPLSAPPPTLVSNLGTWAASPLTLAVGRNETIHVSATAPASILINNDQSTPRAFGVYAELQEQPVPGHWFTVDETLVTFDRWPAAGQVIGPGGGVIRLDPAYVGTSAFNALSTVAVLGPALVREGSSAPYSGRATYADGTIHNFTNTAWSVSRFAITTNGVFAAGNVTSNSVVTVTAPYSYGGFNYSASLGVLVSNLPPPNFTAFSSVAGGGFALTLSGVPQRLHVIEGNTNLLAGSGLWIPLMTNTTDVNGLLNFTNYSRTNFPRRFYRAREM